MAQLEFVNRSEEIKAITSDIQIERNQNRVVILRGATGIGKSRLTERVIQLLTSRPSVKMTLRPNKIRLTQDGLFIRTLAVELDEKSRKDIRIPSFKTFLNTTKVKKEIVKKAAIGSGKALMQSNVVTKTILAVSEGVSIPVNAARQQFAEPTADNTILAYDYFSFVSDVCQPIINIENVQSIDESSLQLLGNFLATQTGQYLLLEYTEEKNDLWSIHDLKESLQNHADISFYHIERLKVEDVLKIIKKQPEAIESLVRNLYLESNGSLRPLTDFYIRSITDPDGLALETSANAFNKFGDFTSQNLKGIDNATKFILFALAIHGGWLESDLLQMLGNSKYFNSYSLVDVSLSLDILIEKSLIEVDDHRYKVKDDIFDYVSEDDFFKREKTLAIATWKNIYLKVAVEREDVFVPKAQAYHYLVYFSFLEGDAIECIKYLDQALFLAVRSFAPTRMLGFVQQIRDRLKASISSGNESILLNVDKRILSALQNLSYNENALSIANQLPECEEKIFYRSILLENTGKAKDALFLIDSTLSAQNDDLSTNWKLRFELSKFAALRALLRYEECKSLFESMYNNKNYSKLIEFGYVCRCAGSCLDYLDAIPYVRRSVEIFASNQISIQEAYSRIELSVMLADTGETGEAKEQLSKAEELLDGQISERHTILNNRANLSILEGKVRNETIAQLKQAFLTSQSGFDKTAIRNNMMIALSNLDNSGANEAARELLESCKRGGFTSRELICIALHNATVYFQLSNDIENKKTTQYELNLIREQIKPEWLPELSNIESMQKHELKKLYEPVFISNWSLELTGTDTVVY